MKTMNVQLFDYLGKRAHTHKRAHQSCPRIQNVWSFLSGRTQYAYLLLKFVTAGNGG